MELRIRLQKMYKQISVLYSSRTVLYLNLPYQGNEDTSIENKIQTWLMWGILDHCLLLLLNIELRRTSTATQRDVVLKQQIL
ncbi:hypothetical protein FKM82_004243 [Ascaphus truei]